MSFKTTILTHPSTCSICLGDITLTDESVVTHGGGETHPFHMECIHDWFYKGRGGACPNCRLNITDINGIAVPNQFPSQVEEDNEALRNQVRAVYDAVIQGNQAALQELLPRTPLTDYQLGIAIRLAANRRDLAAVHSLLENSVLSVDHRSITVLAAARRGDAEIVKELLRDDAPIYLDDRIYAVWIAKKYNHTKVLEALPLSVTVDEITLGRVVHMTIQSDRAEKVQALLEFGPIAKNRQGIVIEWALEHGHPQVIRALLENSPVTDALCNQYAAQALLKGQFMIARELMRNRTTNLCLSVFSCFN